jgi:Resolvase, N terminal domain
MRVALYVRVSTDRQQQAQTIEQQVTQLRAYVAAHNGWTVAAEHVFRDDGYSGAKLDRPGLDAMPFGLPLWGGSVRALSVQEGADTTGWHLAHLSYWPRRRRSSTGSRWAR